MMAGSSRSLLVRLLFVLGTLAVCAALAVKIMLATDWGRARLCLRVSAAITEQIAGRLEVAGFDELSLTRVRAHGIKIFAPDGKLAIEAETADITFEPLSLLRGRYGWTRADIKNGKVYVTEDAQGKNNMEETFRARTPSEPATTAAEDGSSESRLDLRSMVTSDILLVISGGSLPRLRLVNIYGIMRVHVLADGKVELRFDEYRGNFERGLPTGPLLFRDVAGQVVPSDKRLLHFDGRGKTEGAAVSFKLDIFTEPKTRTHIEARFPELSPAALPTVGVAAWSTWSPNLDVKVRFGT